MRVFADLPIDCYEIPTTFEELLKTLNELKDDKMEKEEIKTTITKQGIYFSIRGINIGGIDA